MKAVAIVGAGLSGAVLANRLSRHGYQCNVFDTRHHLAGNCFTKRDADTGVMLHVYGPHIFHTNDREVWDYVRNFDTFVPYVQRTKAVVKDRVYSLPINLHTINQFFDAAMSPDDARAFMSCTVESIASPRNFEEAALAAVGRELYEAFFRGYTLKQWGLHPDQIPAAVFSRLPIRFDYNDNYFSHRYQGIPMGGYTEVVSNMLDHRHVHVHLLTEFTRSMADKFSHVFYSGPIDKWFGYAHGHLPYRTLDFKVERQAGDAQGCAVLNYCDMDAPYTRSTEHKHFTPWEEHARTVVYHEKSRACGPHDIPFYPVKLARGTAQLEKYLELARSEARTTFIGRLGTFRYLDMDVTVSEALKVARDFV